MSTLSVQMRDLLPLMYRHQLELRVNGVREKWRVEVRKHNWRSSPNVWQQDCTELWQGLDAALAWIWREYGTPREDAK